MYMYVYVCIVVVAVSVAKPPTSGFTPSFEYLFRGLPISSVRIAATTAWLQNESIVFIRIISLCDALCCYVYYLKPLCLCVMFLLFCTSHRCGLRPPPPGCTRAVHITVTGRNDKPNRTECNSFECNFFLGGETKITPKTVPFSNGYITI